MNSLDYLCSIADVTQEIRAEFTFDPIRALTLIPVVSWNIERECREEFEPTFETRIVYPSATSVTGNYSILKLVDPATKRRMRLLELTAVTNGGVELVVDQDVTLYDAPEHSSKLLLLNERMEWSRRSACCETGGRSRYSVSVTGWWGYRERYSTVGWQKIDTLKEDIDSSGSSLQLNGGIDERGLLGTIPKVSPGHLLKINSEVMRCYEIAGTNTIYCDRAQRGTLPALHTASADIYQWSVQPEIIRAAQRWLTLLYQRQGVFENVQITDMGQAYALPVDMPDDVRNILWRFLS